MKEYKIIKQKTGWSKNREKFEDEMNNHAKQGWHVVNVYSTQESRVYAVLERDKNR